MLAASRPVGSQPPPNPFEEPDFVKQVDSLCVDDDDDNDEDDDDIDEVDTQPPPFRKGKESSRSTHGVSVQEKTAPTPKKGEDPTRSARTCSHTERASTPKKGKVSSRAAYTSSKDHLTSPCKVASTSRVQEPSISATPKTPRSAHTSSSTSSSPHTRRQPSPTSGSASRASATTSGSHRRGVVSDANSPSARSKYYIHSMHISILISCI